MIKRKGILVVAALALGMATRVVAGDYWPAEVRIEREVVRFSDLDLKTAEGVAGLHLRLQEAARRICTHDGLTAAAPQTRIGCRNQSVDRAMAGASAELQAYHARWKSNGANRFAKPRPSVTERLATAR